MHNYEQLKARRDQEQAMLSAAQNEQARAMIQGRLRYIRALMAEHQSQYNIPRACECLR